jgi:hypothetical protein
MNNKRQVPTQSISAMKRIVLFMIGKVCLFLNTIKHFVTSVNIKTDSENGSR